MSTCQLKQWVLNDNTAPVNFTLLTSLQPSYKASPEGIKDIWNPKHSPSSLVLGREPQWRKKRSCNSSLLSVVKTWYSVCFTSTRRAWTSEKGTWETRCSGLALVQALKAGVDLTSEWLTQTGQSLGRKANRDYEKRKMCIYWSTSLVGRPRNPSEAT